MVADDALNDIESKSGAFAHGFGSEERLENAALHFGGNARVHYQRSRPEFRRAQRRF